MELAKTLANLIALSIKMPRIRNILQQRANRYRTKQAQQDQAVPLSYASENVSGFTDQLVVKPPLESNGVGKAPMYTLDAATATETFSSEEENTAYSNENDHTSFQDGGEFLDLAYEASRQKDNSYGNHEVIDLVQGNEKESRITAALMIAEMNLRQRSLSSLKRLNSSTVKTEKNTISRRKLREKNQQAMLEFCREFEAWMIQTLWITTNVRKL